MSTAAVVLVSAILVGLTFGFMLLLVLYRDLRDDLAGLREAVDWLHPVSPPPPPRPDPRGRPFAGRRPRS